MLFRLAVLGDGAEQVGFYARGLGAGGGVCSQGGVAAEPGRACEVPESGFGGGRL